MQNSRLDLPSNNLELESYLDVLEMMLDLPHKNGKIPDELLDEIKVIKDKLEMNAYQK